LGSFEKLEIGAIKGSEKVRAIDLLSLVAQKRWSVLGASVCVVGPMPPSSQIGSGLLS